ncbi:hypothetical protein PENANT_c002G06357 [Penicillium antarcticum]|uniref:DNA recombination and repair protein Rad51-like C-terminal domain-containing protein n=1 Tax=Penicillium antarcticum TaxID=416450 RepID=A0A1V6QKG1_9EURO|nr:uncharacterized protein N7508_008421 [Penicillium antarcticum]KAJ5293600.1 hypothetical protein N7508_008421 [Penicillium antarcticum]OQD89447.1 hypothetical protein PENANT_c002G06357 [Penicillium antarcticum]
MAAYLGDKSLADVHHEGLDEILSELKQFYHDLASYDTNPLGLPVLDALLEVFAPKPSGVPNAPNDQHQHRRDFDQDQHGEFLTEDEEMLLHSQAQTECVEMPGEIHLPDERDPYMFPDTESIKKRPLPVVEVSSSLSASGKSQLLYYVTALAILPRNYGDLPLGGRESAVVFIDNDNRFDAERLRVVARGIIMQQQLKSDPDARDQPPGATLGHELESLLVSSLQHVHVFRPQSSSALLATLHSLETYLFDLSRHRSASRPLQMITIDSATAFIWQDRLRDEIARIEEIGRPRAEVDRERERNQTFYLSDLYLELVVVLKRLQALFQCAIVFTTISGTRAAPSSDGHSGPGLYDWHQSRTPVLRPALPPPWGTFPTLRLIVHRSSVRPFPPSMALKAAIKDAHLRQSAIQQGRISGCVNAWGREDWPQRVVEAIEANNGGSFSFYVRESDIDIPKPDE